MASEIAMQMEPLIHIASLPLLDVNSFLTTLTGVNLDYGLESTEPTRPHSAFIQRRSTSEEPSQRTVPITVSQQSDHSCCATPTEGLASRVSQPSGLESHDSNGHDWHRCSVGCIDTDTFGRRNGKNSRAAQLLVPKVTNSGYNVSLPHNHTLSWSHKTSPDPTLPTSISCDSLNN